QPPRPCVGLLEQLGLLRWLHEWFLPCHTCLVGESDQSVRQYSYLVSYSQRFSALWRCAVVCGVVRNYRCVPPATSSPSGSCGTASTTSSILPHSFSGRVRRAWSDFCSAPRDSGYSIMVSFVAGTSIPCSALVGHRSSRVDV